MPYTPAHTIIAAPLWYTSRKRLSLSALMIGCIAPDLPYLAYLTPVHAPGHSVIGLLTHAVPHGLLLLSLWYLWLEKPLLSLLALPQPKHQFTWGWLGITLLSIWLGAATHALLDATSHESGWFVQRWGWLSDIVGPLPIFKWIQYGGGAIGLIAIAWWYVKARQAATTPVPKRKMVLIGGAIFSLAMMGGAAAANWLHQSHDLQTVAVQSATGVMSGFVIGACIYAAIVNLQKAGL